MKLANIFVVGAAFLASTVSAIEPVGAVDLIARCGADWLGNNAAATRRIEWAYKCGHITAGQRFQMYKEPAFVDGIPSGAWVDRSLYNYPSFGWQTSLTTVDVWVAPTPTVAPANSADASCVLPSKVPYGKAVYLGPCQAGCYTAEQEVLFSDGYVSIEEALDKRREDLTTLAPGSSMEALLFQTTTVGSYSIDIAPAKQDLLLFQTASGNTLRVTLNHPIVDSTGTVRQAKEFTQGEELIRSDGSLDPIVAIEPQRFFGKVYNVAPVTRDEVTNIVVAQGFLNGSSRYQNESLKDLNRSILRRNIPVDILE